MFIFIGYPITYCILSVPFVIMIIYVSVYTNHVVKSIEVFQVSQNFTHPPHDCDNLF